jgi:hypothetical protein
MSGFEYVFTFASLLFGLAIANIATGFADVWRDRSNWSIGPLTALLGLVLTVSICRQWLSFWGAQNSLEPDALTIFATLFVAAPYVFLGHAMFPRPGDHSGTHDQYYLDHRRVLLGMLMVSPLFSLAFNLLRSNPKNDHFFIYYAVVIGIPTILIPLSRRWLHVAGLGALALYLVAYIFVRWP